MTRIQPAVQVGIAREKHATIFVTAVTRIVAHFGTGLKTISPRRDLCYDVGMSEVLSTFRLHTGDAAPDFSLPNAHGTVVTLKDAMGPKGLLVVFACNHCPFVVHLADALGVLARELWEQGVHTVAINSNDTGKYPQDGPEHMMEFSQERKWDFPYLIDDTQETAIAYGAACTPDFFLFDGEGHLFYAGQFDDSRPRSGQAAHGGDLRESARRMLAGEEPLARPYPSSGCNIKWKPGKQPAWWDAGG
jgi:peroxiredoxin